MNVVLVGEELAGLQVLRALGRSYHKLVAVLAAPQNSEAAGSNVWNVAQKMGFETWPAKLVKEPTLANRLRSKQVDILLNVHSLYLIHKEVLAAPRFGCFNLHPAPLPRYAGLNAISWSIYRGEKMHGVTIHKMDPAIDAGPIVYQSVFPIEEEDGALSLSFKCIQQGVGLMLKLLDVADADPQKIPLAPQDISKREYFGAGIPDSGQLRW
jgi:methionyl-tRNA formyltransferase